MATKAASGRASPFRPFEDRRRDRALKREAIIHAAAALFAEHGYDRTTLADIAASLAITKTALFHYFSGKEDILLACLKAGEDTTKSALAEIAATGGASLDKVRALIRICALWMTTDLGRVLALIDEQMVGDERRGRVRTAKARVERQLRAWIAGGIADGSIAECDPGTAAALIAGSFKGIGRGDPKILAEHLSDILTRGIAARRSAEEPRGFYHEGMLELQVAADGRRLADFLATRAVHRAFAEKDETLIRAAGFFFIASSFGDHPDCSFKAGEPGFVKIIGPNLLEFPDYDGNYMFRTLGNIARNPRVGLLFIAFDGRSSRIRINGRATVHRDAKSLARHCGAKAVVRVECEDIYPNCPRYIPNLAAGEPSIYLPQQGVKPPAPEWKIFPTINPLLPADDVHRERS